MWVRVCFDKLDPENLCNPKPRCFPQAMYMKLGNQCMDLARWLVCMCLHCKLCMNRLDLCILAYMHRRDPTRLRMNRHLSQLLRCTDTLFFAGCPSCESKLQLKKPTCRSLCRYRTRHLRCCSCSLLRISNLCPVHPCIFVNSIFPRRCSARGKVHCQARDRSDSLMATLVMKETH